MQKHRCLCLMFTSPKVSTQKQVIILQSNREVLTLLGTWYQLLVLVAAGQQSAPALSTVARCVTLGDNKASRIRTSKVIHRKQRYLVTAAEQFLQRSCF